jgi:hypothetical protein
MPESRQAKLSGCVNTRPLPLTAGGNRGERDGCEGAKEDSFSSISERGLADQNETGAKNSVTSVRSCSFRLTSRFYREGRRILCPQVANIKIRGRTKPCQTVDQLVSLL